MGNEIGKLDRAKTGSVLRQSVGRINIHKGKKLNSIAKNKDEICKHLSASNEINAKIWCETLLHEEELIPVYDIVAQLCDQVNGRLSTIDRFGAPKDMNQTFHTLIYAATKLDVEELIEVRRQLSRLLGKEFVLQSDTDMSCINKIVAQNIEIKIPEEGQIYLRLVQLAKERNIDYTPSQEAQVILADYCLRKDIQNPLNKGNPAVQNLNQLPVYNPVPQPINNTFTNQFQPPPPGGNNYLPPNFNYSNNQIPGNNYMNQQQQQQYPVAPNMNNMPGYSLPPTPAMQFQPPAYDSTTHNSSGLSFTIPEQNADSNISGGGLSNPYINQPSYEYQQDINQAKIHPVLDNGEIGQPMNKNDGHNDMFNNNNPNGDFDKQGRSTMDDLEARLEALKRGF
eukprot:403351362